MRLEERGKGEDQRSSHADRKGWFHDERNALPVALDEDLKSGRTRDKVKMGVQGKVGAVAHDALLAVAHGRGGGGSGGGRGRQDGCGGREGRPNRRSGDVKRV